MPRGDRSRVALLAIQGTLILADMRMSHQFGRTLREAPADAETVAHQLLVRGGFVDQLMAGVYSYLPFGRRVKRRVEEIIREEMDLAGGQEVLLPTIQPAELWEQSGRTESMNDVLFRLSDKRQRAMVLGPTHEEVITRLFQDHASSYRDMPVTLYQVQTKLRDETRPRGGLVRVREFTMKDAYSFDVDEAGLDQSYNDMFAAYQRIFARCGIPTVPVEADSGAIGGKGSQEFIFLTETGEDTILLCEECGYAANQEKADFVRPPAIEGDALPFEEIATPGMTTIDVLAEFLKVEKRATAKAVFVMAEPRAGGDAFPVFAVVRGDFEVNEVKLMNALDAREIAPMSESQIAAYGLVAGYASPIGVNKILKVVADISILGAPNLVAGANKSGLHLLNTNYGRDWSADIVADIALAEDGHLCASCPNGTAGMLQARRGIEMGHVFRLGQTYTVPFDVKVQGEAGEQITPVMGCYGIGVERILSAAVDEHHDDHGIIWPASIAPHDVYLVGLSLDRDEPVATDADALYAELQQVSLNVIFDDRDERPGVKFNDADLIGVPIRLTVSPRNHKDGVVELKRRDSEESEQVARGAVVARVQAIRAELLAELSL
jgi:prolyl-tRNA synthetase